MRLGEKFNESSLTIVMAVLTAVPFGLAIRATLTGPTEIAEPDATSYAIADELEAAAPELEPDILEEPALETRETNRARLFALLGETRATLGEPFAGLALGASPESIADSRTAITNTALLANVEVTLETSTILDAVVLRASDTNGCADWADALVAVWGRESESTAPDAAEPEQPSVWANLATQQRAVFYRGRCRLAIEAYVPVDQWIGDLPVTLVGKPVATLRERFDLADAADGTLRWSAPGVSGGEGPTRLTARITNGVVTQITVTVRARPGTGDAIVSELNTSRTPAKLVAREQIVVELGAP